MVAAMKLHTLLVLVALTLGSGPLMAQEAPAPAPPPPVEEGGSNLLPPPNARRFPQSAQGLWVYARDTERDLDRAVVDSVVFQDATLAEVADFLRAKSKEAAPLALPYGRVGVNFVVIPSADDKRRITLTLEKVSLKTVLDKACEMAGVPYSVDAEGVTIGEPPGGRATRHFRVPRDFLDLGGAEPTDDPFGAPSGGGERKSDPARARAILSKAGVPLTEDDEVGFDKVTGLLTVKAPLKTLNLIEEVTGSLEPRDAHTIAARLELYRVTTARALEIIQATELNPDATEAVASLRKEINAGGNLALVETAGLSTRSGQRSKLTAGLDRGQRERSGALTAELEPTLGPDGSLLAVTVAVDYAQSGYKFTLTTVSTMQSGDTVLLGSAGSSEARDTTLLVFLRMAVVPAD